MSRIGKKPIELPANTQVSVSGDILTVKGPKGVLNRKLHPSVKVEIEGNLVKVLVKNPENHKDNALWGLFRSLICNMVKGVNQPYEKKLEINGVGFKASLSGKKLVLNVGYSHPVEFSLPEGITCGVEKNVISLSGIDNQLVGEVAANIRKIKKPEPYLGKGIKYVEEVLRHKAGKAAKTASA